MESCYRKKREEYMELDPIQNVAERNQVVVPDREVARALKFSKSNKAPEVKERIALGTKAYYANLKFFKSKLVTKSSK